ncbi:hypothetical protein [Oceanospirillum sediminis]|uniref:CdiI immunity protein domain-containing protein n=1 Tax=Oceanospirillum sediminis TaxID=2760088 RepID=A0A839ISJ4_9GAMM|nr:hypothetical protein [Oceanospirillum sediminis]MBB1487532.1 hypothetical protein [Oceanospirillum sediminis]
MMYADLIDEVDFKELLISFGAPVSASNNLKECQQLVSDWLKTSPDMRKSVADGFNALEDSGNTLLPEIHDFIRDVLAESH